MAPQSWKGQCQLLICWCSLQVIGRYVERKGSFRIVFWIFSSCLMDLISQESPKAAFGVAVERFKRQKVLLPKPPSQVEGVKLRDGHLGCQGCSTMFLQLQECLGFVFFFSNVLPISPQSEDPSCNWGVQKHAASAAWAFAGGRAAVRILLFDDRSFYAEQNCRGWVTLTRCLLSMPKRLLPRWSQRTWGRERGLSFLLKKRLPCLIFHIQGHEVFLHQRLERRWIGWSQHFFPLWARQFRSFVYVYIYIWLYMYISKCVCVCVCVCGERLTSGTHKDHPGLHTFSMSHQPLFALQAEKRLDGFIDQKSGVIHFEGGMSLEYFSQGLWGCMFQFCIWYGTCLHQQRLDFNSCRMPDFEAVLSFFAKQPARWWWWFATVG